MKDDFNNFIEDTFAEVWGKIKQTSETAKEYVKQKTLRERMDQNIDLKLKPGLYYGDAPRLGSTKGTS